MAARALEGIAQMNFRGARRKVEFVPEYFLKVLFHFRICDVHYVRQELKEMVHNCRSIDQVEFTEVSRCSIYYLSDICDLYCSTHLVVDQHFSASRQWNFQRKCASHRLCEDKMT